MHVLRNVECNIPTLDFIDFYVLPDACTYYDTILFTV